LRKNCLLKDVIEGEVERGIEVKRRRGRRHKQLLDEFKEKKRYLKLKLKEETRCGRGYGPAVRLPGE